MLSDRHTSDGCFTHGSSWASPQLLDHEQWLVQDICVPQLLFNNFYVFQMNTALQWTVWCLCKHDVWLTAIACHSLLLQVKKILRANLAHLVQCLFRILPVTLWISLATAFTTWFVLKWFIILTTLQSQYSQMFTLTVWWRWIYTTCMDAADQHFSDPTGSGSRTFGSWIIWTRSTDL